ncbi:MAG TPA: hypothetical protein VNX29_04710 [Kaistia sp.]|nr:hypothetical protein [Kaistia sp.]
MTTHLITDTPRLAGCQADRDAHARIIRRADTAGFTELLIQVLK